MALVQKTGDRLWSVLSAITVLAGSATVFLVGASTPVMAESSNYVTNSGFETDLSGWSQSGLTRTSAQAHSGSFSASNSVPTDGTVTQVLNDSPNWRAGGHTGVDWIKLSIWVKGDTGGVVRLANGSGYSVLTTLTSTNWTEVDGVFDQAIHASDAGNEFWVKYSTTSGTGTIYMDDASETDGTNSLTCSEPVSNCGFEYPYNLQGWNRGGDEGTSNSSLSLTSDAHSGSQAALLTRTAGTTGTVTLNDSPDWMNASTLSANGYTSCTATAWVKSSTTNGGLAKISLTQNGGGSSVVSTASPSTSWQQLSATIPVNSSLGSLDWKVYQILVPNGDTYKVDDVAMTCS